LEEVVFTSLGITDLFFFIAVRKMGNHVLLCIGDHPPEVWCVKGDLGLEPLNTPWIERINMDGQEWLPALESVGRLKRKDRARNPVEEPIRESARNLHLNAELAVLPTHKEVKPQTMTQPFRRDVDLPLVHPKSSLTEERKDFFHRLSG
jgi:hypothetical protein